LEAKAPISAWSVIITPDDGSYDISGVAEWFIEKENDVSMGTLSLAEFVKELTSQYPGRMSYSKKPVLTVLAKFPYGEIASYGLKPQDGACDIDKILSSIMLQMRIPIGHTTVYKFLKSIVWKGGMMSLAEVERVFKLKAEEERAYLASPQYQKMLRALEFMME
jgi:hypothetical protein